MISNWFIVFLHIPGSRIPVEFETNSIYSETHSIYFEILCKAQKWPGFFCTTLQLTIPIKLN